MKKEIGILGLGSMGTAIALNLKKKYKIFGYDVNKHNRLKSTKNFLLINNLKEIFLKTDTFIIIVLNENQCEKILNTFIKIKKNTKINKKYTIINCTTVSPNWVEKIYKKLKKNNFEYIDCPVSGGPKKAIKGKLSLILSSNKNIYKKNLALLKNLGSNIYNLGNKIGTGSTVKIINNCLAGIQIVSAAEAIILAKKEKINLKKLFEIVNNSSGHSWMFADRGKRMIEKKYFKPLSRLSIFKKDMKLANKLRKKHFINLPLTKVALKMYEKGCKQGLANFDDSAVIRLLDKKLVN
jgi:3-hydroxyisobutyrate dehydrogenase-like beta-hydroxyacid dehydrogenase